MVHCRCQPVLGVQSPTLTPPEIAGSATLQLICVIPVSSCTLQVTWWFPFVPVQESNVRYTKGSDVPGWPWSPLGPRGPVSPFSPFGPVGPGIGVSAEDPLVNPFSTQISLGLGQMRFESSCVPLLSNPLITWPWLFCSPLIVFPFNFSPAPPLSPV